MVCAVTFGGLDNPLYKSQMLLCVFLESITTCHSYWKLRFGCILLININLCLPCVNCCIDPLMKTIKSSQACFSRRQIHIKSGQCSSTNYLQAKIRSEEDKHLQFLHWTVPDERISSQRVKASSGPC